MTAVVFMWRFVVLLGVLDLWINFRKFYVKKIEGDKKMKVVLLEKVKTVGNVGEIVNVSAGHARNYLIPSGLAVLADEGSEKSMAQHQKMLQKKIEEEKAQATSVKEKIDGVVLEFVKKVGLNGKLFGSITSSELASELGRQRVTILKEDN